MFELTKKLALAMGAVVALTSASEAATTRFDFFNVDSNGAWVDSLEFTVGALTLTVTADPDGAKVQHWKNNGLGVKGGANDSSHQVDSYGYDEVVQLNFSESVKIDGIRFSYVHDNDTFDFYVAGAEVLSAVALPNSYYASYTFGEEYISNHFGIGAGTTCNSPCDYSYFKIKYIDVSDIPDVTQVPLPAGALLLVTALAGLGAARRRSV